MVSNSSSGAAKSLFASLAVLGSSSLVTILAGLFSAKIAALFLGVEGVGTLGVALTIVSGTAVLVMQGGDQAVVRLCGMLDQKGGKSSSGAVVSAARKNLFFATLLALATAWLFTGSISRWLFGGSSPGWWLPMTILSGCLYGFYLLQVSTLAANFEVNAIASLAVKISFISPIVSFILFYWLGAKGVIPSVLISNMGIVAVSLFVVNKKVTLLKESSVTKKYRRKLLVIGLPLVPANIMSSVTTLVVIMGINRYMSLIEVGYYRSSKIIAVGYLVIINSFIYKDFFPKISNVSKNQNEFQKLCETQIRFILYFLTPVLVAVVASMPISVRLLLSEDFLPAVELIQWQVVGDLFMVIGAVLSTILFVRSGSVVKLFLEVGSSFVLVFFSLIGIKSFGMTGLGAGYFLASCFFVLLSLLLLHRDGFVLPRKILNHLLFSTVAILLIPFLISFTKIDSLRLIGIPIIAVTIYPIAKSEFRDEILRLIIMAKKKLSLHKY